MTEFIIVRHAQSLGNASGIFVGQNDVALSPLGFKQAEKTGELLKNEKISAFFSSDLRRAYDTAKCIASYHDAVPAADEKLREINAGLWQGKTFEYLEQNFKGYEIWLKNIGDARCDGGESVLELQRRINTRLCEISALYDGKTVCIITHAAPIRVMCCIWQSLPLSDAKSIRWVSNCSITRVGFDGENWRLHELGYDSHLEKIKSCFPSNV